MIKITHLCMLLWFFVPGIMFADVQQIQTAVAQGDIEQVKKLFATGISSNFVDEEKVSLLHDAAAFSSQEMVEFLLDNGAYINARADYDCTPLMFAAAHGNEKNARLLIARGARLDICNVFTMNALHVAISQHKNNMVPVFMEAGLPFDYNAFAMASWYNNIPMLEYGLSLGFSINELPGSPIPLIHLAIDRGNLEALQFLIKHGADIEKLGTYPISLGPDRLQVYMSAMMVAAQRNQVAIMEYLHQIGVPVLVEAKTHSESGKNISLNPLHVAVCASAYEALDWLCAHGYSWTQTDAQGDTLLHYAIKNGDACMTKYLLVYKGIGINQRNNAGQTPLHYACQIGNYDICMMLLAFYADIEQEDKEGIKPLIYAVRENHTKVAELLLYCGADVVECHIKPAREYAKSNRNIRLCKHLMYHEEHGYAGLAACPFCKAV